MNDKVAEPLLEVRDLSVTYGEAKVLFEVSFDLLPGEALAVLGSNGAGKSSLAKALCGLVRPSTGSIKFDKMDVTGWPAHKVSRVGLAYLPEGRGIFPGLTVQDNFRMFVHRMPKSLKEEAVARSFEMFPQIASRRSQGAGTLSGGEQQMLALARALIQLPRLLIADEASLGLAPMLVDKVFEGLQAARQAGVSVIIIEQFVHKALTFADRCVILQRGHQRWSGNTSEAKEEVLAGYLGPESVELQEV
jgi:branched-chain amino acid transport system ATP-binding protein